jgi:quinol monooxygenase YgiN
VDDSWRPAGRGNRSWRGSRSRRDDNDSQDQRDARDSRDFEDSRDRRDDGTRYGRHAQRPDSRGYESGQYAQDPYRRDPYDQDQYGQNQYSQDQYRPDPYGQEQYRADPHGQDRYRQDQYRQDQYGRAGQYNHDQRVPDPYGHGQYGHDPYARDRYSQEQYGQGWSGQGRPGSDHRRPESDGSGQHRYEAGGGERTAATGSRTTGQGTGPALAGSGSAASAGAPFGQQVPDEGEFGAAAAPASHGRTQSRPYGRIQIFTLLDDKAADFDRLAEQTAEEVRIGEPDTLVYVIHLVPNAPMQRIFYEIYRDRAAFDSHENKSYTKRFVAERRSYVLATNVIELRLKYAKVAPLPVDSSQLDAGRAARAQLPPGPRHDGTAARPAAASGQWTQPPADPRYGRV